jgi:hypothetical protein
MGIYEFGHNIAPCPPRSSREFLGPELNPNIKTLRPDGLRQRSDIEGGRKDVFGSCCPTKEPEYVEEFLMPGFTALDESMKMYWSGMRVPTKDSYRFMRVKVAGGDKSVLIWHDELEQGRIRLPVASVSRTGAQYNPEKFSTPLLAAGRRYTSNRMDRIAKIYRPVPFLVDYDLLVWAEHKRDLEYILYQISIRFNPLAEFVMFDEHLQGAVQLRFGGFTDASDKEATYDQQQYRRYEFKMTAEAWLPLPEKVVPTVLGTNTAIREGRLGDVLLAQRGTSGPVFEPGN